MLLPPDEIDKLLRQRVLSAAERLEALLMAAVNDDRASLCAPDQPALRKVFEMNSALFRKLACHP